MPVLCEMGCLLSCITGFILPIFVVIKSYICLLQRQYRRVEVTHSVLAAFYMVLHFFLMASLYYLAITTADSDENFTIKTTSYRINDFRIGFV